MLCRHGSNTPSNSSSFQAPKKSSPSHLTTGPRNIRMLLRYSLPILIIIISTWRLTLNTGHGLCRMCQSVYANGRLFPLAVLLELPLKYCSQEILHELLGVQILHLLVCNIGANWHRSLSAFDTWKLTLAFFFAGPWAVLPSFQFCNGTTEMTKAWERPHLN